MEHSSTEDEMTGWIWYVATQQNKAVAKGINILSLLPMTDDLQLADEWRHFRESMLRQLYPYFSIDRRQRYSGLPQWQDPCFVYGPFYSQEEADAFPPPDITVEELNTNIAQPWTRDGLTALLDSTTPLPQPNRTADADAEPRRAADG